VMNATAWDDHLERNLVCGPNGPFQGYELVCAFHTQVAPVWMLGIGVWAHYLARLQLRLPDQSSRARKSVRSNRSGSSSTSTKRNDARKLNRRHGSWVLTVFGTMGLFASLAHFFGFGCVHDMDDIRGQIGDAFSKFKYILHIHIHINTR
jgi:hypothetical protein